MKKLPLPQGRGRLVTTTLDSIEIIERLFHLSRNPLLLINKNLARIWKQRRNNYYYLSIHLLAFRQG